MLKVYRVIRGAADKMEKLCIEFHIELREVQKKQGTIGSFAPEPSARGDF